MLSARDIAKMLDHSTLQPFLTPDDIRKGCDIALKYDCATVCARPGDMKIVVSALKGSDVLPCTVIGFPHGAHRTDVKVFEAQKALEDGCKELDMVLNIGAMLHGDTAMVEDEIHQLASLCHGEDAILKVILETCFLSDEQKILACRIAEKAGADFVKTSTGYGKAGANLHDIALMRRTVSPSVRVKASGGIHSLDEVLAYRKAGANRCGVSASVVIMEEALKREKEGTLNEEPLSSVKENNGGY